MFGISTAHRANRPIRTGAVIGLALSAAMLARAGEGGQQAASPPPDRCAAARPSAVDGPPPPEPPAVLARDGSGRATVRAVRVATPLRIDGTSTRRSTTPFRRSRISSRRSRRRARRPPRKPTSGSSSISENVYVTSRCWESQPERRVANEMRRDNPTSSGVTDAVAFMFDTFHDRRNGVVFNVNADRRPHRRAVHQRAAVQRRLESGLGSQGRPVRAAGRWRPPFRSSRSAIARARRRCGGSTPGAPSLEERDLVPHGVPPGARTGAAQQASLAATLVGLEAPAGVATSRSSPTPSRAS